MLRAAVERVRLASISIVAVVASCGGACNDLFSIEPGVPRPAPKPDAGSAIVYCDASSAEPRCPVSDSGLPMTCHAASQLGGRDFCVETCDPGAEPMPGFECLASGALLEQCDPKHEPSDCVAPLACYRTDLTLAVGELYAAQAKGVCTTVPVCNDHSDCSGERSLCASRVFRDLVSQLEADGPTGAGSAVSFLTNLLPFDHLHCLAPCGEGGTCPAGEACLADQALPILAISAPRICVPQCRCEDDCALARSPCPPNFYCAAAAGSPYPKVCWPGLPGNRCRNTEDCVMGYCLAIQDDLKVCAIDCATDEVCRFFDSLQQDPFICAEGHCVTRAPFAGEMCIRPDECPEDQACSSYNPFAHGGATLTYPECHAACDGLGQCADRGGIPHVCMPNGECYPAWFDVRCGGELRGCVGELECRCVENCSPGAAGALRICTKACARDEDCTSDPLIREGRCDPAAGACRHASLSSP